MRFPTWGAFPTVLSTPHQNGRMAGYVQEFPGLLYKIPTMMEEESYTLFVRGLKLEVKTSMGVNVPKGLEDAIT